MSVKIHPTAIVSPKAELGNNVIVGPYTIIADNVKIGDDTIIANNVLIDNYVTIGKKNKIYSSAVIGTEPQDLKFAGEISYVEIGDENLIREFATVNRGTELGGGITKIGNRCLLMVYSHVAHDCRFGSNVIVANSSAIAGHVEIGDYAIIGGLTAVHQFTKIGANSIIGGKSRISKDVVPFSSVATKTKTKIYGVNKTGLKRRGFSLEEIANIEQAFKILFYSGNGVKKGIEIIQEKYQNDRNISEIVDFINHSERGIYI